MIEIKGMKPAVGGMFGLGLCTAIVGGGGLAKQRVPVLVAAGVLAVGVVLLAIAVHAWSRQKYQLRATEQGVSFAGSAVIAWPEIRQLFIGRTAPPFVAASKVPALLSIEFHHRRTLLRLPVTFWISSPFSIGDVDIALDKVSEPPDVLVTRLEAMRVRSVGVVDGVVAGASELPPAKVIDRSR